MLLAFAFTACADRIAPTDGSALDAGDGHVVQCVEPRPIPYPWGCVDSRSVDCTQWAQQYAGGEVAWAFCDYVQTDSETTLQCIIGNGCEVGDAASYHDCHCGNEPACGDGSVCVSDTRFTTPHCRCAMQ